MAADEKGPPKAGAKAGGGRRKSPPTIDLAPNAPESKTESVSAAAATGEAAASATSEPASEPAKSEPVPPATSSPDRSSRPRDESVPVWPRPLELAVAAGAGGLIVLLLGFGLQAAGMLPSPGRSAATEARAEADRVAGTVSGIDQRITSLESAGAQAIADRALLDDVSRQVGVVDAFGASLSDRLLNAEASIAALRDSVGGDGGDLATREDFTNLASRVQRLETMDGGATSGTLGERIGAMEAELAKLQSLGSRVDTLAAEVDALAAKVDALPAVSAAPGASEQAARAVAIGSLRRAAASGGAFADDLALVGAFGASGPELAALGPLAAKGVPSRAELESEFPAVAEAILAARPSSEGGSGLFDRVIAYGRDLVKVRPAGPVAGDDPAAVVSRMRAAVDGGDLATALEERKALSEAGQAASRDWAAAAADRIEVDRLVDEIGKSAGSADGSGRANSG